jgi:hypothetical protein
MPNLFKLYCWLLWLLLPIQVLGQGSVNFANRVPSNNLFAPVSFEDGRPVGPNFQAQLYGAPAGSRLSDLKPLFPLTSFRSGPPEALGYIIPTILYVPGIPAGAGAVFVMKAFDGLSWETSTFQGESNPVTVTLANGSGLPPDLLGLQPFQVHLVPEPSTCALIALGGGLLFWRVRGKTRVS